MKKVNATRQTIVSIRMKHHKLQYLYAYKNYKTQTQKHQKWITFDESNLINLHSISQTN